MTDTNLMDAARRAVDAWTEWQAEGDQAADYMNEEMARLEQYVENREQNIEAEKIAAVNAAMQYAEYYVGGVATVSGCGVCCVQTNWVRWENHDGEQWGRCLPCGSVVDGAGHLVTTERGMVVTAGRWV